MDHALLSSAGVREQVEGLAVLRVTPLGPLHPHVRRRLVGTDEEVGVRV